MAKQHCKSPRRIPIERVTAKWLTRFWGYVDKSGECWMWRGQIDAYGYPSTSISVAKYRAHRVAYELVVGPIPPGLTLDHLCRIKACVNPAHLEPVSIAENMLRGTSPAAMNQHKTHCFRGHELTPDNIYRQRGTKGRSCRKCRTLRARQTAERLMAKGVCVNCCAAPIARRGLCGLCLDRRMAKDRASALRRYHAKKDDEHS